MLLAEKGAAINKVQLPFYGGWFMPYALIATLCHPRSIARKNVAALSIVKQLYLLSLFVFGCLVGTPLRCQTMPDATVTINAVQQPVFNVLVELSRQTGYYFSYDAHTLNSNRKISINVIDVTLEQALDLIFSSTTKKYNIFGKQIIIADLDIGTDTAKPYTNVEIYPYKTITGTLLESNTGLPVPFASIGISNTNKGTISNQEGAFQLKVPMHLANDTLAVSSVGYKTMFLPLSQLGQPNQTIYLQPQFVPIQEVIIRQADPLYLIRSFIKGLEENYPQQVNLLTAYYRESVLKRSKYHTHAEAVLLIEKLLITKRKQQTKLSFLKAESLTTSSTVIHCH
ncbi:MAG: hypothetical protein HC896_05660 [Bacteroidales bacterium]|nr:hypothetical protein [Bacteroidales bacterium]